MTNRSDRLDRLVIGFECRTAWERMRGEGPRRFCDECRREVFDFEQMLPAEIHARLQASRGALCVRLTRRDGHLVSARELELSEPATSRAPRRVPTIAAGLVSAWLSTGTGAVAGAAQTGNAAVGVAAIGYPAGQADAGQAPTGQADAGQNPAGEAGREQAPARRARSAAGATLRGRVVADGMTLPGVDIVARNTLDGRESMAQTGADGTFVIAPLPPGIYEVEGRLQGFSITPQSLALPAGDQRQTELTAESNVQTTTVGVVAVAPAPLRRLYDDADLVATAVVGHSVVVSRNDDLVEVLTDLHLESSFKGSVSGRDVGYRHSEYEKEGEGQGPWRAELAPGTRVLAFVEPSKAEPGATRNPIFESGDSFGLKVLGDGERAAYLERLDALARIERQAERSGAMRPADLVEWMVATAENPLTRAEATGELQSALNALDELAAREGTSAKTAAEDLKMILDHFHDNGGTVRNEQAALLGALLTAEHQQRLTAALRATEALGQGDRELFQLVRRWDDGAARDWLERQLRTAKPKPDADAEQLGWLQGLAEDLDDDAMRAIVATARDRQQEIVDLWPDDETQTTRALRQQKLAALAQDLRRDLAAALARKR
jgi:hypothetical protein